MKNMTGKQDGQTRPRISLEKEGMKCAFAVTSLEYYKAPTREGHTGSRANSWLLEIDRQTHTW